MAQVAKWDGKIATVGVEAPEVPPKDILKWFGIAGAALGALILLIPKKKK